MLNIDLIDNLYASLPKDKQQDLIVMLFKRSKQTMNYFRRTKDISLSKLEILADYFHMPLDYFRMENNFRMANVNGNHNNLFNVYMGTNLLYENESLRKDVARLEDSLKDKDELIKSNKKYIKTLEEKLGITESEA